MARQDNTQHNYFRREQLFTVSSGVKLASKEGGFPLLS